MAKVKLALKKKTDAELLAFAKAHRDLIADEAATFATPIPTVAAFAALIDDFETKLADLAAARAAVTTAVTEKEISRDGIEGGLNQRGAYVESQSGGSEPAIESVGFGVKGAAAPVGPLPAPGNLVSTTGDNEGEVDLAWNPVHGAGSYQVECKINNDAGTWQQIKTTTTSSYTATGLDPGVIYAFRVRAIGAAGEGPWSDQAIRRAA